MILDQGARVAATGPVRTAGFGLRLHIRTPGRLVADDRISAGTDAVPMLAAETTPVGICWLRTEHVHGSKFYAMEGVS